MNLLLSSNEVIIKKVIKYIKWLWFDLFSRYLVLFIHLHKSRFVFYAIFMQKKGGIPVPLYGYITTHSLLCSDLNMQLFAKQIKIYFSLRKYWFIHRHCPFSQEGEVIVLNGLYILILCRQHLQLFNMLFDKTGRGGLPV